MSPTNSMITIVARTSSDCSEISGLISGTPQTELRLRQGVLGQMNGTAVSMMKESEIVITRLNKPEEAEIAAIEALVADQDDTAKLIVLSDADMPLSIARRLLNAGVADVLPSPVEAGDLRRVLSRLTRPTDLPAIWTGPNRSQIVTVARARGGIGATTVAVNLADSLATATGRLRKKPGASVVIVDFDLQFGAVASFLDLRARDTLYDFAAEGRVPTWAEIETELETAANGVKVLTAPARFVPLDGLSEEQVGAILEILRGKFEYVIVDLPHSLVDWVQAVIDRTDRLLLVTDSTVPAIRQSKRLMDFFLEECPGTPVEIVINHEAKPMIRGQHHQQAAKLLGRPFETWLPRDQKVARAALDRGVPLAVAGRRSPLSRSIAQLARSVREDFSPSRKSPAKNSVHPN